MSDPILLGLGALAAYFSKDVISKILGPTADYLGGELKEFTKKRMENVGKIFSNAEKKLGKKLEIPGQVPPKVLKTIINEGSYSNDDISVEYFGGVLASSRTEVGRDDRGYRLAIILDRLSTYQIRSHYLIYSTISELFSNSENNFGLSENRNEMQFFMPIRDYAEAMGFTRQEWDNPQILGHIFHGLDTDGLIEKIWQFGNQESLKKFVENVPGDGIICTPSSLGVELFLWAFGHGNQKLEFLLIGDMLAEIEGIPKSISNAVAIKDMTNKLR